MTPFLCLGCFKAIAIYVSLHVDYERLTYFRFYLKNIFECKFIHCSTCTAGSGLHIGPPSFFLLGPEIFYTVLLYMLEKITMMVKKTLMAVMLSIEAQ